MDRIQAFLVFLALTFPIDFHWADDARTVRDTIAAHRAANNLVVWGSPEKRGGTASTVAMASLEGARSGQYVGKYFEIEYLPILGKETADSTFQYWVFPTDDTGFGWDEDHPIVLRTPSPTRLRSTRDRVSIVAEQVPNTMGWVPRANGPFWSSPGCRSFL